jgi:hypothetical protein
MGDGMRDEAESAERGERREEAGQKKERRFTFSSVNFPKQSLFIDDRILKRYLEVIGK